MSFSHWLVDENRGLWTFTPLTTGKWFIHGIPAPGPNLFLPKDQKDIVVKKYLMKILSIKIFTTRLFPIKTHWAMKKTSSDWSFFCWESPSMRSSMYQTEPRWDGAILYGPVAILGILQVEIRDHRWIFGIFPANIHGTAELTMVFWDVKGC